MTYTVSSGALNSTPTNVVRGRRVRRRDMARYMATVVSAAFERRVRVCSRARITIDRYRGNSGDK